MSSERMVDIKVKVKTREAFKEATEIADCVRRLFEFESFRYLCIETDDWKIEGTVKEDHKKEYGNVFEMEYEEESDE